MKPDIDLQLQVVIRSLSDVILPAIDPENKPANEQIHLCLHNLNIAKNRIPFQRRFVRSEIRDSIAFLEGVLSLLKSSDASIQQQLQRAINSAQRALDDAEIDTVELVEHVDSLRSITSKTLQELVDHPAYPAIERKGIELTKTQLDKARAWFVDCGIEADLSQLSDLHDII